ncbi:DUF397 domain-containing protein [Kibdelosporangium phytohabitans]|uniref:DUF397 domain-containing protein n=1 Tax=Kibdelosporangium phytohabitans TaxID=860235 RepID=A0A0N9IC73_9PSEU|nr:DUF397 domain-containing protein [Kibdelosporangium phytohabitans]ALG13938.1 hypothetical protein AOZ06_50010 [Kibdelosporangium phytohabitans]MBE1467123.1 hypothetical protein [Kibdelosporangium phytohabitans]
MESDAHRAGLLSCASWRTSSYSTGLQNCVEVNTSASEYVGVRDSKLGADSPVLVLDRSGMRALLFRVKSGQCDRLAT